MSKLPNVRATVLAATRVGSRLAQSWNGDLRIRRYPFVLLDALALKVQVSSQSALQVDWWP